MSGEKYFDEFLDNDDLPEKEHEFVPSWVSEKNSSLKAYEAINILQAQKKQYIRRHSLKSQFIKKSSYKVSKAEVARMVMAKPQPLFNSVTYSDALSRYLDNVNHELEEAKLRRIAKNKGGLRVRKKEELVKELQAANKEKKDLLLETVDAVYERTLMKLPLDVKRKLKLEM